MLALTRFGAGDELAAESLRRQADEIPEELCSGYTMPLLTMTVDLSVACGFDMRRGATQDRKRSLPLPQG